MGLIRNSVTDVRYVSRHKNPLSDFIAFFLRALSLQRCELLAQLRQLFGQFAAPGLQCRFLLGTVIRQSRSSANALPSIHLCHTAATYRMGAPPAARNRLPAPRAHAIRVIHDVAECLSAAIVQ